MGGVPGAGVHDVLRRDEPEPAVALGLVDERLGELFLSTRTVDMHVRNSLRKLDCRSRVEAAGRAREIGLVAQHPGHRLADLAMARLIYSALTSLDGYVTDAEGNFDWSAPDEEVHTFVNDLERPVGTYLYGRRMYEVLVAWERADTFADQRPFIRDYAEIWQGADKVVYSGTLDAPASARTRIERNFDPEAVRRMKATADRDLSVGGPHLAGHAIEAGLVDECHLLVAPVVVGGGTRALPDGVRVDLELLDQRRFGNGVVHLHYRLGTSSELGASGPRR